MKFLMITIMMMGMGCYIKPPTNHVVLNKKVKSSYHPKVVQKCYTVKKAFLPTVSVLIHRNCWKPGETTVSVIILKTDDYGKKAALDALKIVYEALGKVKLTAITMGSVPIKGKKCPFYIFRIIP